MPVVWFKTKRQFVDSLGIHYETEVKAGWDHSMEEVFGMEMTISSSSFDALLSGENIPHKFRIGGRILYISSDMVVFEKDIVKGGNRMKEPRIILANPSWVKSALTKDDEHREYLSEWIAPLSERFKTFSSHSSKNFRDYRTEIKNDININSIHFNCSISRINSLTNFYLKRRVTVHHTNIPIDLLQTTSNLFDGFGEILSCIQNCIVNTLIGGVQPDAEYIHLFSAIGTDGAKKVYGFYDGENNVGFFSDITHYSSSNELVRILMQLILDVVPIRYSPKGDEVKRIEVKLGTDPEFELLDNTGEIKNANEFLNNIDTARSVSKSYTSSSCDIGTDGCSSTLELRPSPGSPEEVVYNLSALIKKLNTDYSGAHISVKGDVRAIGCHIHFGIGRQFTPNIELLALLDLFVGKPTLLHNGKARGSYGKLSSYEEKPWGFEYRTPPSSIMSNPEIFRITLKVSNLIVSKYLNLEPIKVFGIRHASYRDYVDLGLTREEAKHFITFFSKKVEIPTGSVTQFWCDDFIPIKELKKLKLLTTDDWSSASKDYFIRELNGAIRSTMVIKENRTIVFYGLKKERGEQVICFPTNEGTDIINPLTYLSFDSVHEGTSFKSRMTSGEIYIGLSFKTRTGDNAPILKTNVSAVVEYLKKIGA